MHWYRSRMIQEKPTQVRSATRRNTQAHTQAQCLTHLVQHYASRLAAGAEVAQRVRVLLALLHESKLLHTQTPRKSAIPTDYGTLLCRAGGVAAASAYLTHARNHTSK